MCLRGLVLTLSAGGGCRCLRGLDLTKSVYRWRVSVSTRAYPNSICLQVAGVGVYAGVPYLCAYQVGSAVSCMEVPSLVNVNFIIAGEN